MTRALVPVSGNEVTVPWDDLDIGESQMKDTGTGAEEAGETWVVGEERLVDLPRVVMGGPERITSENHPQEKRYLGGIR